MARTREIVTFLDELLDPGAFADYCPNGLQVPGRAEVDRVVTGVSASLELFERAVAADAGLVLVHHGIFWDKTPRALSPTGAARLRALLTAEVNLVAYHLPLDAHPEVGNNALLAYGLGADAHEPFAAGLDGFLTGEPSEPAMTTAREAGVHFIAAGHYATETFGVRCLGELLAERFGVAHDFIDVPNPV